jgi:phosphatidylglycerophosphate synthase
MFDIKARRLKDKLFHPFAARLVSVPPVLMTLLALSTGLVAAYFAAKQSIALSFAMFLFSRFLDGFDGLIARIQGRQSDFGGYLDILFDFLIYAIVPIGLVLGHPSPQNYLVLAVMLASFYVNSTSWMYLSAILEKRAARDPDTQTTVVMPAGLIGGAETITIYCIFLLFPNWIAILFSLFAALVFVTALQRLTWAWKNIR